MFKVGLGALMAEGHRGEGTHWVKVKDKVRLFSFLSMRSVECVLGE